ncbi:hypothetical protein PIB30_004965 [Stylosanthes scabra]|uniref:Uncharacterized protein n=1 Tax=Stylosanthes scabra TaxID=79078 RepID=A0ABU6X2A9_9FABA|nr:hypothetical protein [Stylosanthes scabra]
MAYLINIRLNVVGCSLYSSFLVHELHHVGDNLPVEKRNVPPEMGSIKQHQNFLKGWACSYANSRSLGVNSSASGLAAGGGGLIYTFQSTLYRPWSLVLQGVTDLRPCRELNFRKQPRFSSLHGKQMKLSVYFAYTIGNSWSTKFQGLGPLTEGIVGQPKALEGLGAFLGYLFHSYSYIGANEPGQALGEEHWCQIGGFRKKEFKSFYCPFGKVKSSVQGGSAHIPTEWVNALRVRVGAKRTKPTRVMRPNPNPLARSKS